MGMGNLRKEDVISRLDYYVNNIGTVQIEVMFVQKTQSKLNKYKTLMFNCRESDIEDMVVETINNMKSNLENKEIDNYDLEVSVDDVVQVIAKDKVQNHEQIMSKITVDYKDDNTIGEDTDFSKLNFVVLNISGVEDDMAPISFYKQHYKSPAKFKGTRRFTFNGKEAKAYNKELLIIASNVDALCIGDYFYIVNREHFNTMLDFKDVYQKIITSNETQIVESAVFENPEQFIIDCKENGRHIVRLTKAILANGFKNLEENKSKLPDIMANHNLQLKLDETGKIQYDKNLTGEILNLLLEHYVTSDLTERRMVAKAIEKYE